MGAPFAPLGTRMTVCSFTPSRMGIITSRLTWSKPWYVGSNFGGVSLCKVAGVCAAAVDARASKRAARPANRDVNVRTLFVVIGRTPIQSFFRGGVGACPRVGDGAGTSYRPPPRHTNAGRGRGERLNKSRRENVIRGEGTILTARSWRLRMADLVEE